MPMTDLWPHLAARLEHLAPAVPADALAEADAHRNTLAPHLVDVLEGLVADPTPARADGYVLHLYAMLLLAHWRDARAYRPLAALGHLDERIIDEVFGQLVHDTFGRAADCVKAALDLLFSRYPEKNVVLTVSPVPLAMTYASTDIGTANMESKSILRAVAVRALALPMRAASRR